MKYSISKPAPPPPPKQFDPIMKPSGIGSEMLEEAPNIKTYLAYKLQKKLRWWRPALRMNEVEFHIKRNL